MERRRPTRRELCCSGRWRVALPYDYASSPRIADAPEDRQRFVVYRPRLPLVPGEEGERDIRVLSAILRCAESGAPVVL